VLSTTAGTNIVQTGTTSNPIIGVVSNPSFTSETLIAGSNQLGFGPQSGSTTFNVVPSATNQTLTFPDPISAGAVVIYNLLAQSISGLKTFLSDIGIQLNNLSNSAGTQLKAASNLISSYTFRLPPNAGTVGQILTAVGTNGDTAFVSGSSLSGVQGVLCFNAAGKSITTLTDTSISPGCGANLLPIIPANTLTVNSLVRATAKGRFTSSGTNAINLNIFINTTAVLTTTNVNPPAAVAGVRFEYICEMQMTAVGVSGTAQFDLKFQYSTTAGVTTTFGVCTSAAVAVNTALPVIFDPHFKFQTSAGTYAQTMFYVQQTVV
jgi:hypothetical protein